MARSISVTTRSAPRGAVALLALAALGGCATGSTASFTMAPLIFAEQTDVAGEAVPVAMTTDDDPALAPSGTFDRGIVHYVSVGGNALLPVNALRPPSLGAALAPTSSPATLAVSAGSGGIALAAAGPAMPGSLDATLLGDTVATVQGASAIAGLTTQATVAGQGVAVQATAAAAPASLAATAGPLSAATVSQALIVSTPLLSGSAAAPVSAGTTNLLTASASNMVRMCLLKGCR